MRVSLTSHPYGNITLELSYCRLALCGVVYFSWNDVTGDGIRTNNNSKVTVENMRSISTSL